MRRAFATVIVLAAAGSAAGQPAETWTDGVGVYESSPPLEGYSVPPTVFDKGYDVPLERVLAAARKMTAAELAGYTRGPAPPAGREFQLFVFKNHGVNTFAWEGRQDGQQRLIPRYWDGELWRPSGTRHLPTAGQVLFYLPREQDRCFVMLTQSRGTPGADFVRTDRVRFAALPPVEAVIRKGVETADAVVYVPGDDYLPRAAPYRGELVDCVKGSVTGTDLRALFPDRPGGSGAFLFLSRVGDGWREKGRYTEGSGGSGGFRGTFGEYRLSIPEVRAVTEAEPWLKGYTEPGPVRWRVARSAAGPAQQNRPCRLRVVNPGAGRGEWTVLELTAGKTGPSSLVRFSDRAGGPIWGEDLGRVQVRRGEVQAELPPAGRFDLGPNAPRRDGIREDAAVGVEYQTIHCGPGVMRVAIRPKAYPWSGTVQGRYEDPPPQPLPPDRDVWPTVYSSRLIELNRE